VIVPSIDIMDGQAVQLVGGRDKALDAGNPVPIAERFRIAGEIAVVDLDAATGGGSNGPLVRELCRIAPCRVGGGIRSAASARDWLDAGAAKIVLGTAAEPEVLRELPAGRVVIALDAVDGEVVVDGWRTRTGRSVVERMTALRGLADQFLVTFVEREGRMGGIDPGRVAELRDAASPARLTVAGGVTTAADVALLDRMGVEAQVGMAMYTGRLPLADAIAAPLVSDRPDGLWPTIIVDEGGRALGLAYSSAESLRAAVDSRSGVYHSRRRGVWAKGGTSGDTQELLRIDLDCDRDTLRFTVRQRGRGFCHAGTYTCWGPSRGLPLLERTIQDRLREDVAGSYTRRLIEDPGLLGEKVQEEARELVEAVGPSEVTNEFADLLYFATVLAARSGVSISDVERELDRRSLRITRRPGDAKRPAGSQT
jgi:phosphoribosyl-ATP pyrophosphohydrolase/phosphoribosyl-AMP cyclohydrolase